jgi:hypothetical protein
MDRKIARLPRGGASTAVDLTIVNLAWSLGAGRTEPSEEQLISIHQIAGLPLNIWKCLLKQAARDTGHSTATLAPDVLMVVSHCLEAGPVATQVDAINNPFSDQCLYGAIHGGIVRAGSAFRELRFDLIERPVMALASFKQIGDCVAYSGRPGNGSSLAISQVT